MYEDTKGKSQEPSFITVPVEIQPPSGNNNEKEKRMAKYATVVEGLLEEETPYGFINNVRKK